MKNQAFIRPSLPVSEISEIHQTPVSDISLTGELSDRFWKKTYFVQNRFSNCINSRKSTFWQS